MSLSPGSRVGPYEIVAPLGSGGMGEVYRARDPRLGREVAIKGLPEAFARHPERLARFEREARLLASLNHPNVATLYGLEESDGASYLVLELVDGETLAARLARGPLPLREALDVAGQVAAAVEAAHERGIVHRDLKPGNVMLTPSHAVKVLDFGLARADAPGASSAGDLSASPTMALSSTGAGVILGTAAYMSPEQARGRPVDRRADVWAFGCVLFECLAGRPVFGGETVSDVIARILEREPDWNALPAMTPPRLRDVVRRCLVKDADERARDIGDLRRELAAIAAALTSPSGSGIAAPAERPSLAVLYFEDPAHDAESEYFCAGITEDIITDLSKIKGLRVASRTAVLRFRGAAADARDVGAALGVGAVLEGSVRRAGGRVRITAQLVNVADGFQVWAERFDRTLEDVFAVQEEIASSIAEALRVALSPAEVSAIAKNRPSDVAAYDLYLQGRQRYGRYDEASLREALALFRRATEVDPGYALAWAGIADVHGQLCQWGRGVDMGEESKLGLEAARRALALDPRLPEAHKAEALNLRFRGERDAARAALLRAIEADPRFGPALMNLTVDAVDHADLAGAERWVRRALDVDPQEAFGRLWLATLALYTRRPDEALAEARRVGELSSEPFYVTAAATTRTLVHLQRGDLDAAAAAIADGRSAGGWELEFDLMEAAVAARRELFDEAERLLARREPGAAVGLGGRIGAAIAAIRLGRPELAVRYMTSGTVITMGAVLARLDPALHALPPLAPFAPARSDLPLVWPLEAPMMEASVHRLFREVRVESGLPPGSDLR